MNCMSYETPDHHNNKMLTKLFTKIHILWYAIPKRKSPTVESANITKIVFILKSWWPDSQANHWAGIMVAHAAAVWMMNVIKLRIAVSIHGNIGESFTKSVFPCILCQYYREEPIWNAKTNISSHWFAHLIIPVSIFRNSYIDAPEHVTKSGVKLKSIMANGIPLKLLSVVEFLITVPHYDPFLSLELTRPPPPTPPPPTPSHPTPT